MNWVVRHDDVQKDIDQLKELRDKLDQRIRAAQTFATLWSNPQSRNIIRETWRWLGDVGEMCKRKLASE
jgi:hypothetical protein